MKRSDNMKAALDHTPPLDTVPIWELEFHLWNHCSSRKIIMGKEFAKLTPGEQEKVLRRNAEIMLTVAEELHFAAMTVPGQYWEVAPGQPAYFWLPSKAQFRQVEILGQNGSADIMLVATCDGVLGIPGSERYVDFSYKLFDAPEEIDEMARQFLHRGLESIKPLIDLGVEALCLTSDQADNHGPFFNPSQMQRFVLPYLVKWCRTVKGLGAYAMLHTDGNIEACLESLVDTGIQALQAIDPVAGMDIRKVKERFGSRLCLCGNVDCGLLGSGTPAEIHEVTRHLLLDCKEGGGLVLGASNAVQQDTPAENYRAMIEAWKQYGQY